MAKQRAKIGDIIEIKTPVGLAYVQYTHDGGQSGELVRVLPGLYEERPSNLADVAQQKELYFVFYILNYALRGDAESRPEIVSNLPVPEWARAYPLMRHSVATDSTGRTIRWRIISAASRLTLDELQRIPLLSELTPEQEKLSIREIWPHAAMVKELARGWTPERAESLRLKDVAERTTAGEVVDWKGMRHFLYFPKKSDAEGAGEQLRNRGFSVEVGRGADGENWLAQATSAAPRNAEQMEELRDQMEALATQFRGEYDGWEAAIDSIGTEPKQKVN